MYDEDISYNDFYIGIKKFEKISHQFFLIESCYSNNFQKIFENQNNDKLSKNFLFMTTSYQKIKENSFLSKFLYDILLQNNQNDFIFDHSFFNDFVKKLIHPPLLFFRNHICQFNFCSNGFSDDKGLILSFDGVSFDKTLINIISSEFISFN
jgi:hypothetical protein